MHNFSMRIQNNNYVRHNCSIILQRDIDNIPLLNIYTDKELNNKIHKACKDVLIASVNRKNNYKYGEVGIILSALNNDIYQTIYGEYHSILNNKTSSRLIADSYDKYYNIINKRRNDLIFIHNHPNNSIISHNDIIKTLRDKLTLTIAIGNKHNIYVFDPDEADIDFIQKHIFNLDKLTKDKANKIYHNILNSNNAYKLGITHFRRCKV